jgi:ABC-type uncharacterized transport system substrate-binding protein
LFNARRDIIVGLAARHAIPAIYEWREFAAAGGLASYGTRLEDAYHQIGFYAGSILKGAKPATWPHGVTDSASGRRRGDRVNDFAARSTASRGSTFE